MRAKVAAMAAWRAALACRSRTCGSLAAMKGPPALPRKRSGLRPRRRSTASARGVPAGAAPISAATGWPARGSMRASVAASVRSLASAARKARRDSAMLLALLVALSSSVMAETAAKAEIGVTSAAAAGADATRPNRPSAAIIFLALRNFSARNCMIQCDPSSGWEPGQAECIHRNQLPAHLPCKTIAPLPPVNPADIRYRAAPVTLNNRSIAGERPTVRRRRRIVTFSCHKRETLAVGGRRYTHGSS